MPLVVDTGTPSIAGQSTCASLTNPTQRPQAFQFPVGYNGRRNVGSASGGHPMTVRTSVIVAIAYLLAVVARCQAQPPAQDVEKRLQALEERMDRVLKLLEARGDQATPRPTPPVNATSVDKLRAELAGKKRDYREFRRKNPLLLFRGEPGPG
jgi:hypothetical protein